MTPSWTYRIDGADLVVENIYATCFGGRYDKGDDGETESGVANDGSLPWLMGVALPIRSTEAATAGSPLAFKGPHIPWGSVIKVWVHDPTEPDHGESAAMYAILIDNGPNEAKCPSHALDLNPPLAATFAPAGIDPHTLANDWSTKGLSFRVIKGARYAPAASSEQEAS
jgi:hypothetical protein